MPATSEASATVAGTHTHQQQKYQHHNQHADMQVTKSLSVAALATSHHANTTAAAARTIAETPTVATTPTCNTNCRG
jgi:hypothetical protein